jgi:hypothetical protein
MKSIKYITLGAIVTLSIFSAVIYSSCSKDECGAVTCLNKTTCQNGICICTKGLYGASCETAYRDIYAGDYKGKPPDDPASDTTNILRFVPTADTTNFNSMDVVWIDTSGAAQLVLPIELNNHSTSGSVFNVVPVTYGILTYTGSGTVTGYMASMSVRQEDTSGNVVFRNFYSYNR